MKSKGALYGETLQTTGFYVGRIVIVPREFAPMSFPATPSSRLPRIEGIPSMRFSGMTESIGPMCSQNQNQNLQT